MPMSSAPQMQQETDTEITLGTGKMLVLFFGLVLLCALFFGMGFTMGKNSVRSAPELLATPSGARPSAADKSATQAAPLVQSAPTQSTGQTPGDNSAAPSAPSGSQSSGPANGNTNSDQSAASQQGVQAPVPAGPGFTVQVAAVSKQEDAEALVEALKTHQYAAFVTNTAG